MLVRNRSGRGGGVALAFDDSKASFKAERLPSNNHEILCCVGTIGKSQRKLVVITVYVPPRTTVDQFSNLGNFIADTIENLEHKYKHPSFVITGDFNKRDLSPFIADFPDIIPVSNAPTRGTACLDITFTNISNCLANTLPPLESNAGLSESDHCVLHCYYPADDRAHFLKNTFQFRPFTSVGKEKFKALLLHKDWAYLEGLDVDSAATELKKVLDAFTDECFPMKTRTTKSKEPPWFNNNLRRLVRRKRREYRRARRTQRWKQLQTEYLEAKEQAIAKYLVGIRKDMMETKTPNNSIEQLKNLAPHMSGKMTCQ